MKAKGRIRLLCLLLCLAVLMPCVSALSETTKVTGYLLRLREEASTDGKVIDAYPRGTKVTILKKGDTWTDQGQRQGQHRLHDDLLSGLQ